MHIPCLTKVVTLDKNMRLNAVPEEETMLLNLLQSLRKGNCSEEEWRLLLTRQPSNVSSLSDFKYSPGCSSKMKVLLISIIVA